MQKIISLDLKNIKRSLTGGEKIIILSSLSLIAGFSILSLISCDSALASENITTNVLIEPSLTVTIPSTPLVLNLDPSSTTSGTNNLTITVGTNNATGYKMTMSTNTNSTDLVNTDDNTITIPTLDTGTSYTNLSDFPVNKWGYKKDSGNFIPFTSPTTILESDTYANDDTTTLTFATKIDYLQESGTYNTTFQFNTVANPLCDTTITGYMQTFDPCPDIADGSTGTLTDIRDGQEYTVAKINGNFWMTRNLAIGCNGTGSTYGSTAIARILTNEDSDIDATWRTPTASLTSTTSTTNASALMTCNSQYGANYNYAAISAGTITVQSSVPGPSEYSICPSGWRLPTLDEANSLSSHQAEFKPVTGAQYYRGVVDDQYGYWPTNTKYNPRGYYYINYRTNGSFSTSYASPYFLVDRGTFVRCIRSS